jgi:hypothetical protein
MKTLKAIGLVLAVLLFLLGTRFEIYHYQGSFWTLNRYTGKIYRCVPNNGCGYVGTTF